MPTGARHGADDTAPTAVGGARRDPRVRRSHRKMFAVVGLLALAGLLLLVGPALGLQNLGSGAATAPGALSAAGGTTHTVTFEETGLPRGTSWSVDLSGTVKSSTTSAIVFPEPVGTYPFTVVPVPGYAASPSSGEVQSSGCMAEVRITFTPTPVTATYTVWVNETGLPSGTSWWVDLNGTNTSSTSSSIPFTVPNGTYAYAAPAEVAGAPGVGYATNESSGSVVVDGANANATVAYSTQYLLTVEAYPLAGGNVSPASGWYPAGDAVDLSAQANASYVFVAWVGVGDGNYSGPAANATVTMDGPITELAQFNATYTVYFLESGLPDGQNWTVTLNGSSQTTYFSGIEFPEPNGTYAFSVAPIAGFQADVYQGTVTVAGADAFVYVAWSIVWYNVTFNETGLPSDTPWTVTLNGSSETSPAPSQSFQVRNGTYPFAVGPVPGYTANVTAGSVLVQGANVTVFIGWTVTSSPPPPSGPSAFTLTFTESGLPSGSLWTVQLSASGAGGSGQSSTAALPFSGLSNGTYSYVVLDVGTYVSTPSTGSVTIVGQNLTVPLTFATPPTPAVQSHGSHSDLAYWILLVVLLAGVVLATVYAVLQRKR